MSSLPPLARAADRDAVVGSVFDNSYARDLDGFSVPTPPTPAPLPRLVYQNVALADELGLPASWLQGDDAAHLWSGNVLPRGAQPVAQIYAGHQFGHFSPQLGDGRALLLGEVVDRRGRRFDVAFKGSGPTPFSRGGDGRAALGPMLREVLIGEGMHALGIPTTRALAVTRTGAEVARSASLPGAVLTRIAASHLRVGTFEYFAARGDVVRVKTLAEYAIARHDPALVDRPDRFLAFLRAVALRQASLIAQWVNVGFIHGVMNTDNMAISGETIDYGPCAFLESYAPATAFSSIDRGGRYAYRNQPAIAQWNLARLAEALLPLLDDDEDRAVAAATAVLDEFPRAYRAALLAGQRKKLGLRQDHDGDVALVQEWLDLLEAAGVDFTSAWRALADVLDGDASVLLRLFSNPTPVFGWLTAWRERLGTDGGGDGDIGGGGDDDDVSTAAALRAANPRVIPRNHLVEEALAAASDDDDFAPFEALKAAIRRPYDAGASATRFAEPAAADVTARYQTFCGT